MRSNIPNHMKYQLTIARGDTLFNMVEVLGLMHEDHLDAVEGMCVHRDPTTGRFKKGVPPTASGYAYMPCFLRRSQTDSDVSNDGGDVSQPGFPWVAGQPTGTISALCGHGGIILNTTAFKTGVSYPPNRLLYSPTTGADAGLLLPYPTSLGGGDPRPGIVGVVGAGIINTADTVIKVLDFYPVFALATAL